MAIEYRSKDKEFMAKLKKSVIQGMKGHSVEEKKSAWKQMERRIILDDMHKYAIEQLDIENTNLAVQMGTGDLRADLLVLTLRPLYYTKEGREFTEKIIAAGKFRHVYYTARYKTKKPLKSQKETFDEILRSEIKVLKPKAILCFGQVFEEYGTHKVEEHDGIPIIQTKLISPILTSEDEEFIKEQKNIIWNDVKQIRPYYKK